MPSPSCQCSQDEDGREGCVCTLATQRRRGQGSIVLCWQVGPILSALHCPKPTAPTPAASCFLRTRTCSLMPCLLAPCRREAQAREAADGVRTLLNEGGVRTREKGGSPSTHQALALLPAHGRQQAVARRQLLHALVAGHRLVLRHGGGGHCAPPGRDPQLAALAAAKWGEGGAKGWENGTHNKLQRSV